MVHLLLSLSVFLLFSAIVAVEVNRSIKRGFIKTLISLSGIVLSIVIGIFGGRYLGDVLGRYALNLMKKYLFKGTYIGGSINMENIASMLVQAILSSVFFVVIFLVARGLFAIVMGLICKYKLSDTAATSVREDKTRRTRAEKWKSVIAGAVCGILVTASISSPVLGAFGLLQNAVSIADKIDINMWEAFRIREEQVKLADAYSRNFPSVFVYSMGGKMIYTASATAKVKGETVSVPLEMSVLEDSVDDIIGVIRIFGEDRKLTEEDVESLDLICELADDSVIFRHVLAEYIQTGTQSWLKKGSFMAVPAPIVTATFDSLFYEILRICAATSADTVGNDVRTLVHIYGDILECSEHDNIVDAITYSDIMMDINNELKKNTRMNSMLVRRELYDIIVASMAAQMMLRDQWSTDAGKYVAFLDSVASSATNAIDNGNMTRDQRIAALAGEMNSHCLDMGYQFSYSALTLVSEAIIDEFTDSTSEVTARSIAVFFGGTILEDLF